MYREGLDRESLRTAIDILATARRPLVVFAEDVVTRANDRLIVFPLTVTDFRSMPPLSRACFPSPVRCPWLDLRAP